MDSASLAPGALIRTMTVADLDAVLAIAAASPEAPHWSRRDYEQALASNPYSAVLVRSAMVALAGEEGDGIAGFVIISCLHTAGGAECELESIAVAPAYRRRGIASALLGAAIGWASRSGASLVRLEVRLSNHAALALYGAHQFQISGRRPGYYRGPVEDALLLELPLAPRPP